MIYHKTIGFPKLLVFPDKQVELRYTDHADAHKIKKYRKVPILPTIVRIHKDNIIEATTNDDINIQKVLIRIEYDAKRDLAMVLDLTTKKPKVVTYWMNRKNDKHKNLDHAKYDTPVNE